MRESPRRRAESLPPRMATPQAAPRGSPGVGDAAHGGGDFPLPGEPDFASQYQRKEADWYRGFGDRPAAAGGDSEVTFKPRGLGALGEHAHISAEQRAWVRQVPHHPAMIRNAAGRPRGRRFPGSAGGGRLCSFSGPTAARREFWACGRPIPADGRPDWSRKRGTRGSSARRCFLQSAGGQLEIRGLTKQL